ncbi:MAG: hypothetical protein IKC69_03035 [Clostridia bacterium]|nr:hypothetical protein [Clostridia bacterium]
MVKVGNVPAKTENRPLSFIRILFCIIIITTLHITLTSCVVKEANTFRDKLDEIESISIVELGEYREERFAFSEKLLAEIPDPEEFKEKLADLDYKQIHGDPMGLKTGDVVIKIVYDNGDFDLIDRAAQLKYRAGRKKFVNYGYTAFEKEGFKALMGQYLEAKTETASVSWDEERGGFVS